MNQFKAHQKIKVGISSGDPNGVGIEIILKIFQDKDIFELFTPIVFSSIGILSDQKKHFKLKNAWVNYQRKHEYFGNHTHNGLFSFALWIKVPYTIEQERQHVDYANRNIQRLPAFHFHYTDAMGTIRDQIIPVDKTYENKLILFPGNMNHSVTPFYTSDEYRITVSGNIEYKPL